MRVKVAEKAAVGAHEGLLLCALGSEEELFGDLGGGRGGGGHLRRRRHCCPVR